ncbi:MAG: divalent-cation tolerance protein CutA [Thermoanaerobaculia bacterium]
MHEAAVIVLTSIANPDEAARIARELVDLRLAACVNVAENVRSFYRWEGKIADEAEQLLVIKTTRERIDELREHLLSIHPYDVPEFIVIPIAAMSVAYGEWLFSSTATEG